MCDERKREIGLALMSHVNLWRHKEDFPGLSSHEMEFIRQKVEEAFSSLLSELLEGRSAFLEKVLAIGTWIGKAMAGQTGHRLLKDGLTPEEAYEFLTEFLGEEEYPEQGPEF